MAEAARLPSSKGLHAQTHVTLVGLLAATGLRPGEALALDARDVDLQNGILTIRQTKFGKSRFVPLDETTRVALTQYVERRDAAVRRLRTAAFLITERGTRLNKLATRRTFAKVSCAVGLRAPMGGRRIGWGPRLQDLRHTFATALLNHGCPLNVIQILLGHASLSTTEIYTHVSNVQILNQYAKAFNR